MGYRPTLFFVGGILVQASSLDQIQELAQRIIESEGLELVDLEFKTGKTRSLLRILLDKTGGVTLSDCETISRQLSAILDVKDLIPCAYILEVSSPGIDRPFKTDRDYERSLGRMIKIQYLEGGQPQSVIGKLLEANDQDIIIQKENRLQTIRREFIRRAQQEIVLPSHPRKNRKRHRSQL